ncbi:MAG TPA: membrane protein insertase YidC [Gemmatimonadaceae bacterium]|nr:membrane protein insertase YidC [Gemmatimonadaceae bacterium]
MDRRLALALLLSGLAVVVSSMLFPPAPRRAPRPPAPRADTTARAAPAQALPVQSDTTRLAQPSLSVPAETLVVENEKAQYAFSTAGAAVTSVVLKDYRALNRDSGAVRLIRDSVALAEFRLVAGRDTVSLNRLAFTASAPTDTSGKSIAFQQVGGQTRLTYQLERDGYVLKLVGEVSPAVDQVIVTLPRGVRSEEANVRDDRRYLAFALKPARDDARSVEFSKLDPGERRQENGPFTWVATKNKYFLVALISDSASQAEFARAYLTGGAREDGSATGADAHVVLPVENGRFSFEIYAGPQEWRRLRDLGRDMEHANPYGGFMKGVVQPFATIVMRLLLWMHDTIKLSYGWVLVVFGVAVRIILWPLNQRAMRSSLKMQAIQPEMAAIQKKYRSNPQKQQEEMVRIYREHGMSPLSMFSGCLPMLIPMPVLFALFFVFQNTIEFRGVSFLWLQDISLKDPYYLLPLLMGASMYILSWIGLRNAPPNPQAKMMSYMFPVIMTVALLNMAAGLNLYYAVQNVAALPQQWLIARERARHSSTLPRRSDASG